MMRVSLPAQPLLAAIDLTQHDESVLRFAKNLALRLKAPLHLVHALRPTYNYTPAGDLVLSPFFGQEIALLEAERARAKAKLLALKDTIPDINVETHLMIDFPSDAILALAREIDAALILAGVNVAHAKEGGFFAGMATGFALASASEVPVLLIPTQGLRGGEEPLRILVADNLESEGLAALAYGVRIAEDLNAEALYHLHVEGLSEQDIDGLYDSSLSKLDPDSQPMSRDEFIKRLEDKTLDELRRRLESKEIPRLNHPNYKGLLAFGKAAETVHKEVIKHRATIMVFGRHHLLHRKTLSLGRIPYRAMVEDGIATLIVPEFDDRVPEKLKPREDQRKGISSSDLHFAH